MDSIEWSRLRWAAAGEPEPDHFAAMAAILRLHQLVGANLDRLLKEHNLGQTAYLVLASLQLATEKALPMSQLGRRLLLHATTISLTVDQLQAKGWVIRKPHPTDRRTTLAVLTPEGADLLSEVNAALGTARYGLDGVGDRLAIALTEVIRHVRTHLGDL
jgi:DNA-binding MarR family transcriptional regulator